MCLDIASVRRVTGAARAVAAVTVAGVVSLALDNDAVAVVVVAVDEEGENEGQEEEDTVHDTKSKAGFEHSTALIHIHTIPIDTDTEDGKRTLPLAALFEFGAVPVGDTAELIDSADEGTDEEKVDEGDEAGGVLCTRVQEQRSYCPCCPEHGDNEKDEDEARSERLDLIVERDEPGEHA